MKRITILILEDNHSDLELILYELKKLKIEKEIVHAGGKNEFLTALSNIEPDIVLSDYNLPDINGEESLSILRAKSNDLPFILVSSTIGEEKAVSLMRNGANDFIMKDKLKKLVPTIERELKEYENRKQAKVEHTELIKLTTAVDQSPSIIVITDTDGMVEYVNPKFTEITGFTYKDVVDRNPRILKSGEMSEEEYSKIWKHITTGSVWRGEYRNRMKNGAFYWEGATIAPVFDENRKITNFLKVSQDITDKKQMEASLLREKISLEDSNRELEQFAYIASHDLQEPLRIVSSFSQLLELKHTHRLNDEAKEYLEYIVTGAKRMQNLIRGLLEYSRISSKEKQKKVLRLTEPLKDAIYNLNLSISEAGAEVIINDMPDVFIEPDQIAHVFQNIIGNALKFRRDDIKCVIEISSAFDKEKNEWKVSVRDNGIGIDKRYFEKVFVIFNRLESSKNKAGEGIGLALCKRIIDRHSGRIWVESEGELKGSVFFFTIPNEKRS
jgi:PAS domain S-box-containing protein